MFPIRNTYIICFILLFVLQNASSQIPDFSGGGNTSGGNRSRQLTAPPEAPDTTTIKEFYLDDLNKKIIQADTVLNQFHLYSPAESGRLFSQTLGNLASSTRHLFHQSERQTNGLDFGYHQFDLFRLDRQHFQQIDSEKAVSNLFFSPGSSQTNFLIKTQFSRPFKNDLQLTIDYQRVIQEGRYESQNTRTTNLGISLWKSYPNRDMIFTVVTNANNETHNGGVSTDTLFQEENFNLRTLIPTVIENAETRQADQDFALNNYFTLKKYEGIRFRHEIAHKRASFKFVDEALANRDFYGDLWVEDRGIRSFITYRKWETSLWGDLDIKSIHLQAGINYSYYNIDQEPTGQSVHDISLLGTVDFRPTQTVSVHANGYLGIGENIGEFTIDGHADLEISSKIDFQVNGMFKRYRPSLIQQQAFINQLTIWDNDFSQPLENKLSATLGFPDYGVQLEVSQSALTNPIYFDQTFKPIQFNGTVFISQLYANTHHQFKFIHFKNQIGLQTLSESIFNLPQFLTEQELYFEDYIFKKRMLARLGFRLKTVESYVLSNYSPVHGAFYYQNETTQKDPFFYQADVYLSFKVDTFRAFLRAENLSQLITKDVYQLVNPYPIFDYRLRFGVAWTMFN